MTVNHLKHMAIGAGIVFTGLFLVGVPIGSALTYGLLLACPLMMVAMMVMMGGRAGHGSGAAPGTGDDHGEREPTQADRRT